MTRKVTTSIRRVKTNINFTHVLTVTASGLLMIYVFNPPASWLNHLLLDGLNNLSGSNIVLLGLVIGAMMMAIDMGGPFNKAAYVFATGALIGCNAAPITAAMIGGMIPPLIATAMLSFRRKFTKEQRGSIILTM